MAHERDSPGTLWSRLRNKFRRKKLPERRAFPREHYPRTAIWRQDVLVDVARCVDEIGLLSEEEQRLLWQAAEAEWDDAIHIAAPWETRSSLCGNWDRNLVSLDEPRPDGISGCWTCLMAAEWLDKREDPQQEMVDALKAASGVLFALPKSAQSKRRSEVLAQINRALGL